MSSVRSRIFDVRRIFKSIRHEPEKRYCKHGLWSLLLIAALLGCTSQRDSTLVGQPRAKSVILLIMDGCSFEQLTLARWVKGQPLALDAMLVGAVRTHSADSFLADSAAAASAYATGIRMNNRALSVGKPETHALGASQLPSDSEIRPFATVLEGAKLMGKATGIVATSRVTHATPAAFMAHTPSRKQENDVMEQAVFQNIDVVLGGGKRHLTTKPSGGYRTDGEDLEASLKERGYHLIETRSELAGFQGDRCFGLFAPSHLEAEIDRTKSAPDQPSLEEMTRKAIEVLSRDPDGFFLMVEGSQVDWAGHANDPAHLVSDLLMFDKAVEAALDYARKDGRTLVLALSDHNTGGFSLGNERASASGSPVIAGDLVAGLKRMQGSSMSIWKRVAGDRTVPNVKRSVQEIWGMEIEDTEAQQILALADRYKDKPHYAFGEVLCPRHTYLGWTTHGHSGGDVPLFAYGPQRPSGLVEGPDIGKCIAKAMGLDLPRLSSRLFVDIGSALEGGKMVIDKSDVENPIVRVEWQGRRAALQANKSLLNLDDHLVSLEGVVVTIPESDHAYAPLEAIHRIKGSTDTLPPIAEP